MKTTEISIWEENDESSESGRTVSAWGFTLNGERFGGYCATQAEAFSDAERILEGEINTLTTAELFAAYSQLFGQVPTASEDDARELLFDRMCES
jgi:hypothetical protein